MLCALIMAGGKGTRFWPLSTEDKPKQFLNLVGNKTMIQMTVDRMLPIVPIERIYICTGEKYVDLIREQLPNLPLENIIIEPQGRNTAPCIALSTLIIERKYKDATVVVLPSDHLIKYEDQFRDIILKGNDYLNNYNENAILTLGIKPTRPETGYGYIKYGSEIDLEINKVEAFVEKPDKETAKTYLDSGNYLWNAGMFIWKADTILNEIKKYIPQTYEALGEISTINEESLQKFVNENYLKTNEISIDYAVLEKSSSIYVIKSDIGWDDIGTWQSIERYRERDEYNNIFTENTIGIDSKHSMVIGKSNKKVIMIGVENVATIVSDNEIYIINRNLLEQVRSYKEIIDKK